MRLAARTVCVRCRLARARAPLLRPAAPATGSTAAAASSTRASSTRASSTSASSATTAQTPAAPAAPTAPPNHSKATLAPTKKLSAIKRAPPRAPLPQPDLQEIWDSMVGPGSDAVGPDDAAMLHDKYDKMLQLDRLAEDQIVPYVRQHFWDFVRARPGRLQKQLKDSVATALVRVVRAKARSPVDPTLPSMVLVSQLMAPFDRALVPRLRMMLSALDVLATPRPEGGDPAASSSEQHAALARDVVGLWKHISMLHTEVVELDGDMRWELPPSITTVATLPARERQRKTAKWQLGDEYATALQSIFPTHHRLVPPIKDVHRQLGAALVGTLVLFRDDNNNSSSSSSRSNNNNSNNNNTTTNNNNNNTTTTNNNTTTKRAIPADAQKDAQPLCRLAQELVVSLGLVFGDMKQHHFDEHPWLGRFVREQMNTPGDGATQPQDMAMGLFRKRIRAASTVRNVVEIEDTWREFEGRLRQAGGKRVQANESVMECISVAAGIACAHRRLQLRDRILALLAELGLQPTVKIYTQMITGFKQARMPEMMLRQWDEAVRSGVQFDMHIWTAWVSGLIEGGLPRRGLLALKQMSQLWEQHGSAATSPHAVELNITAINAAVTGLMRTRQMQAVRELLDWASRKGIRPDLVTYNLLLDQLLRADDRETAEQLIAQMRREGVEPDVTTYSLIIHANLTRAAATATPDEQVATVRDIFARMEADGVRANPIVYADIIKALIVGAPHGPGCDVAIDEVRTHMRQNKVAETPHILTMLAQRELSRDPPDLAMIRELAARRTHTWLHEMDTILWERVMVVLASADQDSAELASEALAIFEWIHTNGSPITLSAKKVLLDTLVRQRRMDDCRIVVAAAVKQETSEARKMDRPARRSHGFWAMAQELGLLGEVVY